MNYYQQIIIASFSSFLTVIWCFDFIRFVKREEIRLNSNLYISAGEKKKGFVLFVYPPEASSGSKDAVKLHPAIDGNLLFLCLVFVSASSPSRMTASDMSVKTGGNATTHARKLKKAPGEKKKIKN